MKAIIETKGDAFELTLHITEELPASYTNFYHACFGGEFSGAVSELESSLDASVRKYRLTGPFRAYKLSEILLRAEIWAASLEIVFNQKVFPAQSPQRTISELYDTIKDMPERVYELGSFELSQPMLFMSDPCYEPGAWCNGAVEAEPGNWICDVLIGSEAILPRVKRLRARHASTSEEVFSLEFTESDIEVGVDSGQCGLFDATKYKNDAFDREAYAKLCVITIEDGLGAGIIPAKSGVVSRSGLGDGVYSALVRTNTEGRAIAVQLIFMSDEDREEAQEELTESTEA